MTTTDPNFNITYDFNNITEIAFNRIGSSYKSPVVTNVTKSSGNNKITIYYTANNSISIYEGVITNISVNGNFFKGDGTYLIVLSGTSLTTKSNMYILLPFSLGNFDNKPSSSEVTKILNHLHVQFNPTANSYITRLNEAVNVNNLIDTNSTYTYCIPKDNNNTDFLLYKNTVSVVYNNNSELMRSLNITTKAEQNYNLFINPSMKLTLDTQQIDSEIMIDCQPINITPAGETRAMEKVDRFKATGGKAVEDNNVLVGFLIAFIVLCIIGMFIKIFFWFKRNIQQTPIEPVNTAG
jgi:hypothetical protein